MRRCLAFLAVLLVVGGCQQGSKRDTAGRGSRGFYAPNEEVLWDVSRREMARAGFPPDLENSSRENHVMVSRWQTQLMPFSGKGWREQATLKLFPTEGQPGYWSVEVNVTREANMNSKEPGNPALAEWQNPQRVPEKERQIVFGIETFFVNRDVSPRFRTDYDMPSGGPAPLPPTPRGP